MSVDALWYLARGSGAVSLVLLTAVLVLGIANRRGLAFAGLPRLAVAAVHRSIALLAVVFVTVHVITLFFDPYAQLNLLDVLLPFTAGYRPLWTGLGTIALDLMLALVVTSLLRDRLRLGVWRAVHRAAYALWPIAVLHGFTAGTDGRSAWLVAIDGGCLLTVCVALTLHPALSGSGPAIGSTRRPAEVSR